jgi:NADPH:quinone reductase-like Zn-dependent oxidoreductase
VSVAAAGVNPVDWKMRGFSLLGMLNRLIGPRGPFVCGVDFAGTVTEVGSGVSDLRPGDRVVGGTDFSRRQRGSYARTVQVRASQVAVLPESVKLDEAACLPVAAVTAQTALFTAGGLGQVDGARVLVLGASGGVGHFAIQLARNAGATVAGVCSARNAELVRRLGASPLDYAAGDPIAAAAALGPYDVVVDAVGSDTYGIGRCSAVRKPGGVHVLVMPKPRDYAHLVLSKGVKAVLGRPNRESLTPLVKQLAAGRLEVVIDRRIPFDEAETAHRISKEGRVVGKLVLVA